MTPPHSELPLEDRLLNAKRRLLTSAYDASPLRVVERKPWLSVAATASATMAATIIATSPLFGRAGMGIMRQGMGLASSLMKSNFAGPLAAAAIAKFTPTSPPSQSAKDAVNAVG